MPSSIRELYPSGAPSLELHQELLHRHARKLETGDMRGTALHERIVDARADLEELKGSVLDRLGSIDQKLAENDLVQARRDGETKRLGVWLALAGPCITALLLAAIQYALRPSTGPGPTHLTSEQLQQLHEIEVAPRH